MPQWEAVVLTVPLFCEKRRQQSKVIESNFSLSLNTCKLSSPAAAFAPRPSASPRENESPAPTSHSARQSPRLHPTFRKKTTSLQRLGRRRVGRLGTAAEDGEAAGWRWGNDEYYGPGPERTERRKCAVNTRRRTKERP